MIIDRSDCDVGLPNLTLEGYTPSPLLHIKLQSELIGNLSERFSNPKMVVRPTDVEMYQTIVETWMRNFPPTYNLINPDKSNDASRPWIVSHRYHLHVIALLMLLEAFRAYLTKPLSKHSPTDELKLRSDGINYALRLMTSLHEFFDHVYPRDATFHFVLFCIFDTAAVLCSALMHDQDSSIPHQNDIFREIDKAVAMLKRLNTVNKTARTSYEVLVKVAQRIPRPPPAQKQRWPARQQQHSIAKDLALTPPIMSQAELAMASVPISVESTLSYTTPPSDALLYHLPVSQTTSPSQYDDGAYIYSPPVLTPPGGNNSMTVQPIHELDMSMSTGIFPLNYVDMTPSTDELYNNVNFGPISEQELGDLALMWNYESLNLGFINPGGYA